MKKQLLLIATTGLFLATSVSAQTNIFPTSGSAGVGTITPVASAQLEMVSTSQGFLAPRMTKAQRDAIASPATGLLIYQTNSTPGFYYFDGGAWQAVSAKGPNKSLSNLTATSINMALIPNATGTLDLGSSTFRWDEGYINNIRFADGTSMSTAAGGGGAETDPQVGANTTTFIPKWDGTALVSSLLQDDGTELQIGTPSFWSFGKMNIEQSSHTNTLNLINQYTGTSGAYGVYNILYGTGGSTGAKYGVYNEVSASALTTGNVHGTYNTVSNSGTGISYANYDNLSGTGAAAQYAHYENFTGSGSGNKYGTYLSFGSASGTKYGTYMSAPNTTGTIYGAYYNINGEGANTKYGLNINIPSTTGSAYGVYSAVSNGNLSAYAGFFDGKVYFTGNVGIGSLSPSTKLHVDAGTDAGLGSGGFIVSGSTSSTNVVIDNNEIMARNNGAASTLYLNNDGGNLSLCYASGNVMIGASVPATGYLLSVDGKIMCEELKVQMSESWPDYVFADDYKLPSLYDLEKSINENNHLPGIPAAAEIEANGLQVGDMQVKMMEKIEELTLYIIELQKQIDELKGE